MEGMEGARRQVMEGAKACELNGCLDAWVQADSRCPVCMGVGGVWVRWDRKRYRAVCAPAFGLASNRCRRYGWKLSATSTH